MSGYVTNLGILNACKEIREGLGALAKAIGERQTITYNVIVNVPPGTPEEVAHAVTDAVNRVEKRTP